MTRSSLLAGCVGLVSVLACPRPARAEPRFQTDLRLVDFFVGTNPQTTEGGYLLGVHAGEALWLSESAGIHAMGGAEIGFLYLGGDNSSGMTSVDVTASFSAEVGVFMLLAGSHETGTVLSLSWAPRVFLNFVGGEVASPLAGEVAFRAGIFKVPIWFMRSYDGTSFLGAGLGFQF
jgi:hypothetical protein